jgi:hypothetical protein
MGPRKASLENWRSVGQTYILVSLSSSKRWRPVWSLYSTDPLRLKRTTTSETIPLGIFKVSAISCSLWPLLRISREVNRKKLVKWVRENLHRRIEGQWDRVIFSDESQEVVGNNKRIYIWWKKDEAESRDCVCPPAQRKLSCSILQLSAAIVFSVLATRSRLRLSRVTVQAIRGNLYGSLPYSVSRRLHDVWYWRWREKWQSIE